MNEGGMNERGRAAWRAARFPLLGLALTYLVFVVSPWGIRFDQLAMHGRRAAGWKVRRADLALLETISAGSLILALVVLVLVAALRGRWQTGLRMTVAVAGALASAEVLKYVLPHHNYWWGERWQWLTLGSFPSGHSVIVTSIALAVLSVSSQRWRRILVGPLVAWVAVATSATVTMGWHRPSDVVASFFLATAWHRACTASEPAERRLRTLLPEAPSLTRARARADTASITPRFAWSRRLARTWAGAVPSASALAWWGLACLLVVGAAAEGILTRHGAAPWGPPAPGRLMSVAYVSALAMLVTGAGVAVLAFGQSTSAQAHVAQRPAGQQRRDRTDQ